MNSKHLLEYYQFNGKIVIIIINYNLFTIFYCVKSTILKLL